MEAEKKLLISVFCNNGKIGSNMLHTISSYTKIPNLATVVLTLNSDNSDVMHDHNNIFTVFVNNKFDYVLFLNDTALHDKELFDMLNHNVDLISNFTDFAVEDFDVNSIGTDISLFEIDKVFFRSTLMTKRLGSLLVRYAEKNQLYYSGNPKDKSRLEIQEKNKIYNIFHHSVVDNIYRNGFSNVYKILEELKIKSHINITREVRAEE